MKKIFLLLALIVLISPLYASEWHDDPQQPSISNTEWYFKYAQEKMENDALKESLHIANEDLAQAQRANAILVVTLVGAIIFAFSYRK